MFHENKSDSKKYKQLYLDGFESLIKQRENEYQAKRCKYIEGIFSNPERYRDDLKKMLGYPLIDYKKESIPKMREEKLSNEESFSISRMSFEILDGLWLSGLLFKKDDKKRPMVLVQHGGEGTPELISGFYDDDTANYNQMLERVLQYDVNVFAPQLLIWSDSYGINYDRMEIDARLKRVGSSITAVEVFGITRIIDWFEAQDYVKNFGMVGLSYGGFYTLFASAIDKRIKSSISCAYFNDRTKNGWTDWTWNNAAEKFFDAEIACLVCPRRLCIEVAKNDAMFIYEDAENEWERLKQLCSEYGDDWLDFIPFDGVHEFCKSDMPIKRLTDDLLSE